MTTKGNEHQRAPWRDPSRQHEASSEQHRVGSEQIGAVSPAVRPPPEHADVVWHWVGTVDHPRGEPMWWVPEEQSWLTVVLDDAVTASNASRFGWRWIAPCEPPA